MPEEKQKAVMARGTLSNARDPTAMLISRMAQVEGRWKTGRKFGGGSPKGEGKGKEYGKWQEGGGADGPYGKEGDWGDWQPSKTSQITDMAWSIFEKGVGAGGDGGTGGGGGG